MKQFWIMAIYLAIGILTGCFYYGPCVDGSGATVVESRDIGGFTGIVNTGSFEVFVHRSDSFFLDVEAQANLLPVIETEISGSSLVIQTKTGTCIRSLAPVRVRVGIPRTELMSLTGSGKILADVASGTRVECRNTGSGIIKLDTAFAGELFLENNGSGTLRLYAASAENLHMEQSGSGELDGGEVYQAGEVIIRHSSSGRVGAYLQGSTILDVRISGSGLTEIAGDAEEAEYRLTSSGNIDALEMRVMDVTAGNSGSGKIFLHAVDRLDATITGSGDILYRGDPAVSYAITGSGRLRRY